jgi:hypothetical protein
MESCHMSPSEVKERSGLFRTGPLSMQYVHTQLLARLKTSMVIQCPRYSIRSTPSTPVLTEDEAAELRPALVTFKRHVADLPDSSITRSELAVHLGRYEHLKRQRRDRRFARHAVRGALTECAVKRGVGLAGGRPRAYHGTALCSTMANAQVNHYD